MIAHAKRLSQYPVILFEFTQSDFMQGCACHFNLAIDLLNPARENEINLSGLLSKAGKNGMMVV